MRQKEKKSSKPAAALVLCFCLMALVSIFAVKANIDKVKNTMEAADVVKKQAVSQSESAAQDVVDSRENASGSSPEGQSAPDFILPVEGDFIMEHSVDMPVYWATLDQYMTHSGIDIATDLGTPVQACAGGTVTKIEEDKGMGVTIEINHGNGLISVYSNLSKDGLIELGEIVTQGQVIGNVGKTSMFEFDSPAHLHFEMLKDNKPVDPLDYIQ